MLAGSHGKNSCVDEAFPCHEIKNPLYFLDASNTHKAPDDDVGNALLRSESFLCLQGKQNQQQESHPIEKQTEYKIQKLGLKVYFYILLLREVLTLQL